MIEDQELCSLFKAESEEHLQRLDQGLLHLEKNPHDKATLEEVFRGAHSLKGAARMLGVQDVETVAHRFEDILGAAKRGATPLSSETVDRLYGALDSIRKLVAEAVTGQPAGIDVLAVIDQLTRERRKSSRPRGKIWTPEERAVAAAAKAAQAPAAMDEAAAEPGDSPPPQEGAAGSQYRVETIRVEPRRLDALMTHAGELSVTNIHLAHRMDEIHDLAVLAEEWLRDAADQRALLHSLGNGAAQGQLKRLVHFTERGNRRIERLDALLARLSAAFREDHKRLEFIANELEEGIRTVRLLPLSTIFSLFPRMVRDIGRELGKEVQLVIEGGETAVDKQIIEEMKDPLMHMIRNSVDHGLEPAEMRRRRGKPAAGTIRLRASQTATNVVIEVSDDGGGLDAEAIRRTALKRKLCRDDELAAMTTDQIYALIFAPGFSTREFITDLSGRGVGMDVVRANVDRLKGSIRVVSTPGQGSCFQIRLPLSLATMRVLIVGLGEQSYAIPVESVHTTKLVSPADIFPIEGREAMSLEGQPVSLVRLADLLVIRRKRKTQKPVAWQLPADEARPCVILTDGTERVGFFVDALLDEQEVVLKPHSDVLGRITNVSGSTILGTGEVCIVLNPYDLIRTAANRTDLLALDRRSEAQDGDGARQRVILLAEDSITTRTQEKRILESAGYQVVTAVDGADALNKLSRRAVDGVVSDVEMPNLDGFKLTEAIRRHAKYKDLPVVLVTSLSRDEDRRRGMEAGANAYLTKPTFDQKVLLDTLRRLL